MQDGITHHRGIFAYAKDDAYCGVVVRGTLEVINHAHVHVHLANILMGEFSGFQVKEAEAFEQVVVEHQVNVEGLGFGADAHLAGDEGKAFAQLQQKSL